MLSILPFQAVAESGQETHLPSKYVWDKLQFGTQWKVYIQVMAYDVLLQSGTSGKEPSSYGAVKSLLDVARDFPTMAASRHPCLKGIFALYGRQFEGKFFVQYTNVSTYYLTAAFRICGVYNLTFNPSHFIDEPRSELRGGSLYPGEVNLYYSWHLRAGAGFGVNCTVSEFTAPRSHGCGDARVIAAVLNQNYWSYHTTCPNWGKHNFVALRITIILLLHYYQKPLPMNKDQQFTKVSFYYQILDYRNVYLKSYMSLPPTRQRVRLGMEYMLGVRDFSDPFLKISDSLVYVGQSPKALVYAFTLYTDDYLTPVIFRQNVTCDNPEAETIFYDGPVQSFWQPVLPVLKYWKCANSSDVTASNSSLDEVRGTVGELNIMFLTPKGEAHESHYLDITWHAERISPGVLQISQINLDEDPVRMIHFHPTRSTSVDGVNVRAPRDKFVHLEFLEIQYVSHTERYSNRYLHHCLDGLKIQDSMLFPVLGQICSNFTAENLLKHYRVDGLTVGQDVTLKKKQYAWLATISAVIIASVHRCVGYTNVFPTAESIFKTYKNPGAIVTFDARTIHFKNGSFAGYQDFRIIFRRSLKACCKLQIVPFDQLVFYELELKDRLYSDIKYTITSEDMTSPARFIIDFSSIGSNLQFGNASSPYGLRLYSMNTRFAKPTVSYAGVWDTEAYSAQIALHSSILTHAAGFRLQVGDGMGPPVCTDERGTGNITASFFDTQLLGPCAKAQLNTQKVDIVIVYKTYENERCCRFDGYIIIDLPINGMALMYLYKPGEMFEPWIANIWNVSESDTNIRFNVLCQHLCPAIVFDMLWDRNSSNRVRIAYRANLIEKSDLTGVAFPKRLGSFGKPTLGPQLNAWNHVCHNDYCYSTPRRFTTGTWGEAQKACEENQASLVSINSDLEWALLTRLPQQAGKEFIELYNIRTFTLFYIGLVTEVSTKHGKKIENLTSTCVCGCRQRVGDKA